MKRMLAACLLLCALPGLASAAKIDFNLELNGGKMVVFDAVSDMPGTPGKEAPVDPVLMAIDMQIAVRFERALAQLDTLQVDPARVEHLREYAKSLMGRNK
mgnify:CR=1 FL=1